MLLFLELILRRQPDHIEITMPRMKKTGAPKAPGPMCIDAPLVRFYKGENAPGASSSTGLIGMLSTASTNVRPDFSGNRFLQALLAIYAAVWIWAAIHPVYRFDWFLENILTVLALVLLVSSYRRFPLSDASYLLIFLFLVLHTIGGHYTYSEVPFGFWLKEAFDLSRNHFDRIVHFSFGLLLAYPLREATLRMWNTNGFLAALLAFCLIATFSGIFEIIEWIVAAIVDPEAGAAYLGTQGDEFDAQKDMALAKLGAVIALGLTAMLPSRGR